MFFPSMSQPIWQQYWQAKKRAEQKKTKKDKSMYLWSQKKCHSNFVSSQETFACLKEEATWKVFKGGKQETFGWKLVFCGAR